MAFTAVVTSALGPPPDGETIAFDQGKAVLGTGTLSGGTASFMTSTLKVGTNAIKAVYAGDSKFAGSTSNVVEQVRWRRLGIRRRLLRDEVARHATRCKLKFMHIIIWEFTVREEHIQEFISDQVRSPQRIDRALTECRQRFPAVRSW